MMRSPLFKPLKALAVGIACALVGAGAAPLARAQIPVVDVAALIQQVQSYLQLITQYETQLNQYQTQLQQYQNMVQNTAQLARGGSWTNLQSMLSGINTILGRGQSLALAAGNINAQFSALFPSYVSLLNSQITQASMQSSYQALSANTQLGFKDALSIAQRLTLDSTADPATIANLEAQARGTNGNLQALQSVASIDVEAVSLLQQVKTLLVSQLSAASQYYAEQQELDLDREAATQKALQGSFPGWGSGKSYSYDTAL